jgi:hypothetical protein
MARAIIPSPAQRSAGARRAASLLPRAVRVPPKRGALRAAPRCREREREHEHAELCAGEDDLARAEALGCVIPPARRAADWPMKSDAAKRATLLHRAARAPSASRHLQRVVQHVEAQTREHSTAPAATMAEYRRPRCQRDDDHHAATGGEADFASRRTSTTDRAANTMPPTP